MGRWSRENYASVLNRALQIAARMLDKRWDDFEAACYAAHHAVTSLADVPTPNKVKIIRAEIMNRRRR